MTTIDISADVLAVRFTRTEKVLGLVRDLDVPLADVVSTSVETQGVSAPRGLRAPGLGLPGIRNIGTWRRRGHRTLVSVRRGQPALRVQLSSGRYDELLIGADDAHALAARIGSAHRP